MKIKITKKNLSILEYNDSKDDKLGVIQAFVELLKTYDLFYQKDLFLDKGEFTIHRIEKVEILEDNMIFIHSKVTTSGDRFYAKYSLFDIMNHNIKFYREFKHLYNKVNKFKNDKKGI